MGGISPNAGHGMHAPSLDQTADPGHADINPTQPRVVSIRRPSRATSACVERWQARSGDGERS
jgi:hypothetical protein